MKQVGWDVFYLRHIFHLSQWYRLRSCALLGIRAADRPNMLPNVALGKWHGVAPLAFFKFTHQIMTSSSSRHNPHHGRADDPGSYNYVPYANWDSDYLHWCTDGK